MLDFPEPSFPRSLARSYNNPSKSLRHYVSNEILRIAAAYGEKFAHIESMQLEDIWDDKEAEKIIKELRDLGYKVGKFPGGFYVRWSR